MELRHLRYFVAVAEELHFTRAAERLRISPPALTEQIQGLERELGVQLLIRNQRTVALTDAGSRFLEEAKATLRQAERAELVVRRAGRGEVGEIEIGYVSSASCTGLLAQAITQYRVTHAMVSINIHKIETSRQLDQLTEGRLDVGFLRPPARYPVGIRSVIISQQIVLIVLPKDHPLASATGPIQASMLAGEPFIAPDFEREIGIYQHTAELGHRGGFAPRMVARAPDFFTIVTMVSAGFGIAAVPQSCACIQIPGIVYRPVAAKMRPAELAAAFRRDERAPAVKAFVQQLRRMDVAMSRHYHEVRLPAGIPMAPR
jgi:DNA-binding transcriptional LysR family regulator